MSDQDAKLKFGKSEKNTEGFSRNEYETPLPLFQKLNAEFNFSFDLAASPDNAKCANFFTEEQNSLAQSWHGLKGWLWLNPPYSPLKPWIQKAQDEAEKGAKIVMLVPPVVTTRYFTERLPEEIRFIVGRINFCYQGIERKGNMHDSCLLVFEKGREAKVVWHTNKLEYRAG